MNVLLQKLKVALSALLRALQKGSTTPTMPPQAPPSVVPNVIAHTAYLWDTPQNARHSVRLICDEEGLSFDLKNILTACIAVESGFFIHAIHQNKNLAGIVLSTDYGICQVNDFYHIGAGKDFPSTQYVLDNPEACVRWMCRLFEQGKQGLWTSFSSGLYQRYL